MIPGQGVKIAHALGSKNRNVKQKQYCNKFHKHFKEWSILKKKKIECIFSNSLITVPTVRLLGKLD